MISYDASADSAVEEFENDMADKSPEYRIGYSEGALDSAKGFYLSLKEIHDNTDSHERALSEVREFAVKISAILVLSGKMTLEEI